MMTQTRLQLAEDLLLAELNLLEKYNRLLERDAAPDINVLLRQFRDSGMHRIDRLQEQISTYRNERKVSP